MFYYHVKANVVADALSKLCIGSFAHVKEEIEQEKDDPRLSRLWDRLISMSNCGVTNQNGQVSSLVVWVKEKGRF